MTRLLIVFYFLISVVMADVKSTTGQIKFDTQMDNQAEMTLNGTGLGIGVTPSANLHVNGNAIVSDQLFVGGSSGSSNLNVNGTLGYGFQTVSSNTTLGDVSIVLVDSSSDNITITLPYAGNVTGREYQIKKISTSNAVWVSGGGNLIDDTNPIELANSTTALPSVKVMSDGSQWYVIESKDLSATVAADNLVGWWKLDETSGDTVFDSSGQNFHGSIENFATNQIGQDGILYKSVEVDGVNDYIDLPTLGFTRASGEPLTVTAWIKPSSNTIGRGVIFGSRNGSGSGDLFKIEVNNSNQYVFEYDSTGNGGIATGSSISTGWAHIAAIYDGSDIILYINGLEVSRNTGNPNAAIDQDNYQIGKRSDSNTEYFDGNIDDLRLYNKALSQDEVSRIQNATR